MQVLNTELVDQTKYQLKKVKQAYIAALVIGGALLMPILSFILGMMLTVAIFVGVLIYTRSEVKKHYKDAFLTGAVWLALTAFIVNVMQMKFTSSFGEDIFSSFTILTTIYIVICMIAYVCVAISYGLLIKSFVDYRKECRQFESMLLAPNTLHTTKIKPAQIQTYRQFEVKKYSIAEIVSFVIRALLVIVIYFTIMNVGVVTAIIAIPFRYIMYAVLSLIQLSGEEKSLFIQAWANVYLQSIFAVSFISLFFKEIYAGLKKMKWSTFSQIFLGYGISITAVVLTNIFLSIVGLSIPQSENQKSLELIQQVAPIPLILAAVLLAPITEELVFRQGIAEVIYRVSHKIFQKVNTAVIKDIVVVLSIIISGTLFGLIHVLDHGDYIAMIPYVISGVVYTTFYFLSDRNVTVTIGIHMLNNLVATIITL